VVPKALRKRPEYVERRLIRGSLPVGWR